MSKQKKLITEILAASYAHPTASQIFEEARKRMPNIALGTVYRNLGVLVDEGTIVRLSVTGQPDRFDLPDDAHWHVICDKCGQLHTIEVRHVSGMHIPGQISQIVIREVERLKMDGVRVCEAIRRECLQVTSSHVDVHDLGIRILELNRILLKRRIVCESKGLDEHTLEVIRKLTDLII